MKADLYSGGVSVSTQTLTAPAGSDNADALVGKAQQALTVNDTFLAIASPTNAQISTQVQRLTRQTNALIRLLLGALADISDT